MSGGGGYLGYAACGVVPGGCPAVQTCEGEYMERTGELVTVGSPVYVSATNCPIFHGGQGVFFWSKFHSFDAEGATEISPCAVLMGRLLIHLVRGYKPCCPKGQHNRTCRGSNRCGQCVGMGGGGSPGPSEAAPLRSRRHAAQEELGEYVGDVMQSGRPVFLGLGSV